MAETVRIAAVAQIVFTSNLTRGSFGPREFVPKRCLDQSRRFCRLTRHTQTTTSVAIARNERLSTHRLTTLVVHRPSLVHSRLKTFLFRSSFPPQPSFPSSGLTLRGFPADYLPILLSISILVFSLFHFSTCLPTAKNRDLLRNLMLGNPVWATFT